MSQSARAVFRDSESPHSWYSVNSPRVNNIASFLSRISPDQIASILDTGKAVGVEAKVAKSVQEASEIFTCMLKTGEYDDPNLVTLSVCAARHNNELPHIHHVYLRNRVLRRVYQLKPSLNSQQQVDETIDYLAELFSEVKPDSIAEDIRYLAEKAHRVNAVLFESKRRFSDSHTNIASGLLYHLQGKKRNRPYVTSRDLFEIVGISNAALAKYASPIKVAKVDAGL
jgi:hypothetical protein